MHVRLLLACALVLERAGCSKRTAGAAPAKVVAAARRGDDAAVLAWLDGGGRADATYAYNDQIGRSELSLLMAAASRGHERVVEVLLQRGAEIDVQSSKSLEGVTALMAAASQGHERVVDLLIQRGADIDLQSRVGYTALIVATRVG